jgi:hypothetical protein
MTVPNPILKGKTPVYQRALPKREPSLAGQARLSSLVAAPGHGVISEIDSQALCYAASTQVAPIRKGYKDGVNGDLSLSWSMNLYARNCCGTCNSDWFSW